MKAKLESVKAVMSTFQFLVSYFLGKIILKQSDNLSKTLQNWPHAIAETLSKNRPDQKSELYRSSLSRKKKRKFDAANIKLSRRSAIFIVCLNWFAGSYTKLVSELSVPPSKTQLLFLSEIKDLYCLDYKV